MQVINVPTWLNAALQRREDVIEQNRRHHVVDGHLHFSSGAEFWTNHAAYVWQTTPP